MAKHYIPGTTVDIRSNAEVKLREFILGELNSKVYAGLNSDGLVSGVSDVVLSGHEDAADKLAEWAIVGESSDAIAVNGAHITAVVTTNRAVVVDKMEGRATHFENIDSVSFTADIYIDMTLSTNGGDIKLASVSGVAELLDDNKLSHAHTGLAINIVNSFNKAYTNAMLSEVGGGKPALTRADILDVPVRPKRVGCPKPQL